MLHILRSKKFARRVMLGILILIIPAFVLWGTGSMSGKQPLTGTIDNHKITIEDRIESMQGFKSELLLSYYNNYTLFSSILKNHELMKKMGWDRLVMIAAANKEKIKVSDQELLSFLGTHPLFIRDGVFNKQMYNAIVTKTLGMDMKSFEDYTRDNMKIRKLQSQILKSVAVGDDEILSSFTNLNNKFNISYLTVPLDNFDVPSIQDEKELLDFYNTYKAQFTTPKKVQLEFAEIKFKNEAEKNELAVKVVDLLSSLTHDPVKFKEITEESGFEYTKTGLLGPDDIMTGAELSQDIYSATFNLNVNEISEPYLSGDTEGSIFIFNKTNEISPVALPFEDVKTKIEDILVTREKINMAEAKALELYNAIQNGTTTMEEAASLQKTDLVVKKELSSKDYVENIGPASFLFETSVPLEKGKILKPKKYPKGAVIIRVDEVIAPDQSLFDKEKDQIKNQLLGQKRSETLELWLKANAPKSKQLEGYNKF
ncbi:MAG: peptidylprolyl isomerase [Candidatus Omnitrophica bacterium]|nr:peptidylprolyl isomerase [Candidatus Omnitrophota bacterium]